MSGFTYPDSQPSIRKRLAGLNVNETKVKIEVHTILSFADIVAMKFTVHIVGTEDGVRGQSASLVLELFVHETVCIGGRPLTQGIAALEEGRITAVLDLTSTLVCASGVNCRGMGLGVVVTLWVSWSVSVRCNSFRSIDDCLTGHSGDGRGACEGCKESGTHLD